jgi:glycosyltransferase involved in cell wall biosynthesis
MPTLTLAASALARKGANEVALVAKRLGARILILGLPPSDVTLWEGVEWFAVGYDSDWLARSDVVLLPAYVEHQPRALLTALAAGIPVIASAACGLGSRSGVIEVLPGDPESLKLAIQSCLAVS